jgi:hypothetical protein
MATFEKSIETHLSLGGSILAYRASRAHDRNEAFCDIAVASSKGRTGKLLLVD